MVRAAIFDMDGLLIDSEPIWRRSHVQTVADAGYRITEDDVRKMTGMRTDEVVRQWHDQFDFGDRQPANTEARIVVSVIEEIGSGGTELPGVRRVIAMLAKRAIPLAVASSSSPEVIDAVLAKLNLHSYFQVLHSAKEEQFGKPHPAVFLTTATKLGVEPAACVVFEDSPNGVRAAKAAGMKCIAVPEPVNRSNEAIQSADLVVDSLKHLEWTDITGLWE